MPQIVFGLVKNKLFGEKHIMVTFELKKKLIWRRVVLPAACSGNAWDIDQSR